MIRTVASRIAMTTAAACMVFSPIAAQANTRAGDSGAIYSRNALSQPGFARAAKGLGIANDDDDDDLGLLLLYVLGGAAVIAAIIVIDDEDDQSPGT